MDGATDRSVPRRHNDYSVASGKPRCRGVLAPHADEAALDKVMAGRVSIVNVWCPLDNVVSDPLAFVPVPVSVSK